jgi:hypothetical protein
LSDQRHRKRNQDQKPATAQMPTAASATPTAVLRPKEAISAAGDDGGEPVNGAARSTKLHNRRREP